MHLGLGHAQMSRKLLVFLCRRIGHFQPSLVCGAAAQLDTQQPIIDPHQWEDLQSQFPCISEKPINIEIIHVGKGGGRGGIDTL